MECGHVHDMMMVRKVVNPSEETRLNSEDHSNISHGGWTQGHERTLSGKTG